MVVGSTGDILGRAEENLFMKRLLNGERIILVVQAPAMVMRNAAFVLMRSILSMFQALAGAVYLGKTKACKEKIDPPLFVHIDELSESLYWDFINLLNKSRGAGIGVHGLCQSISDLSAKVGQEMAKTLLDNFNTQLFFRVNNPETSRYVSSCAGEIHKFTRIMSQGEFTTREVREPLLEATETRELPDRCFLLFTKQNGKPIICKGETLFVKSVPLKIDF
jgi:type IV secretory pathway TraG/TraD family ATPase VirD4